MDKITNFFLIRESIKCAICVFLLMCPMYLKTQNLIPDSSFESNKFIPTNFSEIRASISWNAPSWGTSDLFCKCSTKKKIFSLVNVPENLMGYQYSHSGSCYAGLFAFSHGEYREYLQTPLSAPLEKDKYYCLTMYVSLADYSRASIDQLGVCFLSHKVSYPNSDVITDLNPIYVKIEKEVGKDTVVWHRLTLTYKSIGGESFLLIGSFKVNKTQKTKIKAPKNVKTRINQISERDSYYFIDDVSLFEGTNYSKNDSIVMVEQLILDTLSSNTPFVFKNILFETNKAILLPISYPELVVLLDYLNKKPRAKIEINGHSDSKGNGDYNKTLSEKRAKAVVDFLTDKGIDKARISFRGYGNSKPIATNTTTLGMQQNRRVEFIIIEK